jgi:hypothetical protein
MHRNGKRNHNRFPFFYLQTRGFSVDHLLTGSHVRISRMQNESEFIPVRKPVTIQMLRDAAERVANEANERHKDYFNGHPVYKIRSETTVGVFDANIEFCVAMSEALPAAYLYVRMQYPEKLIERRLVTRADSTTDHVEQMLEPLHVVTDSDCTDYVYLNERRLDESELGHELVDPVVESRDVHMLMQHHQARHKRFAV